VERSQTPLCHEDVNRHKCVCEYHVNKCDVFIRGEGKEEEEEEREKRGRDKTEPVSTRGRGYAQSEIHSAPCHMVEKNSNRLNTKSRK
jgi:hypothetical protein